MTREITIEPVLNGFVLRVGCQRIVFQGVEPMLADLAAYYKDPEGTEKLYIEKALNKMIPSGPEPVAPILYRREVTEPFPVDRQTGSSTPHSQPCNG